MILNKKDIELYLNEGYELVVDELSWKITIENNIVLGTVRFDTYLKMDLKNFDEVGFDVSWNKRYELKKDHKIWR